MFNNYQSVFTWRYGSQEMRTIFSEEYKYKLWRKIWVSLAQAQHEQGLLTKEELADLNKNQNNIDIERILEIEKETKHDVVAAIREFAEKAPVGGGKIHLGATSMDVTDNADTIRIKEALDIIEKKLKDLLRIYSEKINHYAYTPCLGYTHLQPAEPTTVGYRLAFYAQDLLLDYELLQFVKGQLKGKGMKGAVGTGASYMALLSDEKKVTQHEKKVMNLLDIEPLLITSQVSTRKLEYFVFSLLNSVASSLAKFAADLRILQSPTFGEWSEPFGKKQVGSSAMPFKKNPINAEKICSLARYVSQLPAVALENANLSYLDRTLDDSANRRIIIPEGFLAVDEILLTSEKIISGMVINEKRIAFNLAQYAPFIASEGILMEAVKKGANRQEMHEALREIALQAWTDIQEGRDNSMSKLLLENKMISQFLNKEKIMQLLNVTSHVGNAPERALELVEQIKQITQIDYI